MVFTASQFPHVILCPNLITLQTSKGKVRHNYKELIRIIMTFEYENLLLLKSPQNNVESNTEITEKNKASRTYYICQGHNEMSQ